MGLIDHERACDEHCKWIPSEQRTKTWIPCMICRNLAVCADMNQLEDGSWSCSQTDILAYTRPLNIKVLKKKMIPRAAIPGGRIKVPRTSNPKKSTLKQAISGAATMMRNERGPLRRKEAAIEKPKMIAALAAQHADEEWWDAYCQMYRVLKEFYADDDPDLPAAPSVENVRRLYRRKDGSIWVHCHETSVFIPAALNFGKGTFPEHVMAIISQYMGFETTPWKEYEPYNRILNNRMDEVYVIFKQVGNSKQHRLDMRLSEDAYESLNRQSRSGKYELELDEQIRKAASKRSHTLSRLHLTRSALPHTFYRAQWMANRLGPNHPADQFAMWSPDRIKQLEKIGAEIRNDPELNPYNKDIPRGPLGPNGEPGAWWLFVEEHMFPDHCWEYTWLEFRCRLVVMILNCNRDYETKESPDTLLLLCLLQFFKSGPGALKDPIIKKKDLTIFAGHFQGMSLGRDYRVMPNAPMSSGWDVLEPTELSQWDPRKRTIQFQSWFINRMLHNYHTSSARVAVIRELLRQVAAVTEHYDACDMSRPLFQSPLPPASWFDTIGSHKNVDIEEFRRRRAQANSPASVAPELDVDNFQELTELGEAVLEKDVSDSGDFEEEEDTDDNELDTGDRQENNDDEKEGSGDEEGHEGGDDHDGDINEETGEVEDMHARVFMDDAQYEEVFVTPVIDRVKENMRFARVYAPDQHSDLGKEWTERMMVVYNYAIRGVRAEAEEQKAERLGRK
jgi:hypothetical protein